MNSFPLMIDAERTTIFNSKILPANAKYYSLVQAVLAIGKSSFLAYIVILYLNNLLIEKAHPLPHTNSYVVLSNHVWV